MEEYQPYSPNPRLPEQDGQRGQGGEQDQCHIAGSHCQAKWTVMIRQRSSVLLPDHDGPVSSRNSPASVENDTSSRAGVAPNLTDSLPT